VGRAPTGGCDLREETEAKNWLKIWITGAEHEDEQAGSTMKIIGNRSFTKIFWAISSAC
jgi:hypothetical protein